MSGRRQQGGILWRVLIFTALAGVVAALAAVEQQRRRDARAYQEQFQKLERLEESVAQARRETRAALAAVISPDTLARAQASVYLIVVNGSARGTAFVIDRQSGVLATAAHTADSLPLEDENASVYLINRVQGVRIPIAAKRLHVGYGAFREVVEAYQPIRKHSSLYAPQVAPLHDLAFDAGLLTTDPLDPKTGENILGPDLPLASEDALLALAPGAPIAVIGYPYDTLDTGFAPDSATPRVERGVIAAMTPPLDYAGRTPDPVAANLIIHRLSTAGGNSGSPILNAAGEVIGVHTHGIESASSNADGAAQRADVLYDLLSPEREARRLRDIFAPFWRETLAHWARAEHVLPWSFYVEYATPGLSPAPSVGEIDAADAPPFDVNVRTGTFEKAVKLRRVSAAAGPEESTPALSSDGGAFVIREPGQYAEVWFTADRSRDAVLFAFDYSLRSRRGFCPLTGYWRKQGEARLRVMRGRASFELYLPPTGGGMETYQVILRRDARCDPISAAFMTGEIAWPRRSGAVAGLEPFGPWAGHNQSVQIPLQSLRRTVSSALARRFGDAPEYIEVEGE